MVYDALQYASQVEETAKSHRRERKRKKGTQLGKIKKPNSGEYLSGFYKEDRLLPVITLVIYFSPDKWDGPVCLHEMLAVTNEKLLRFIPDYKINLITPEGLDKEQMERFQTSLREVLLFTKYSKDKEKLYNLVKNDIRFHRIDKKAGRVINAVTGARINMDESGETIDMCKAIQDLQDEAMQAGIKKGIQTGIQTGIKTGKEAGKQEEKEGLILRMLKKKKYTYEEIAELAEVSVEKVKEIEVKMK